jgi:hypothetical protein
MTQKVPVIPWGNVLINSDVSIALQQFVDPCSLRLNIIMIYCDNSESILIKMQGFENA